MHLTKCCLQLQAQQGISLLAMTVPAIKLETTAGTKAFGWSDLDAVLQAQDLHWGTASWAKACNALREAILEALRSHLASDFYLQHLKRSFNSPFEAHGQSQLKLERFETLHTLLDNELLPSMVNQTLPSWRAKLQDMVSDFFNSHSGGLLPADAFVSLQRNIEGHTLQEMLAQLSSLGDHSTIPPDFQLTEDARTAAARAGLADKMERLQSARYTINEIAGLPAMGSYASIAKADNKLGASGPNYDAGIGEDASYQFVWSGDELALSFAPEATSRH